MRYNRITNINEYYENQTNIGKKLNRLVELENKIENGELVDKSQLIALQAENHRIKEENEYIRNHCISHETFEFLINANKQEIKLLKEQLKILKLKEA